jgi:hypothetical protein
MVIAPQQKIELTQAAKVNLFDHFWFLTLAHPPLDRPGCAACNKSEFFVRQIIFTLKLPGML